MQISECDCGSDKGDSLVWKGKLRWTGGGKDIVLNQSANGVKQHR